MKIIGTKNLNQTIKKAKQIKEKQNSLNQLT